MESENTDLSNNWKREYEANFVTNEHVPKLEKMVSERDAQIDFLTRNAERFEVSAEMEIEVSLRRQYARVWR